MVKTNLTKKQKRGAKAYRKGLMAEFLCAFYLMIKGYKIIEYRYKTKMGEIDLIARKKDTIVFIEVKARPNIQKASEAISEKQKMRLNHAASLFLSGKTSLSHCYSRFDVMLIVPWRLPIHITNAF